MADISFSDFTEYVDVYVGEMIAMYIVIDSDTLPQTVQDYDMIFEEIYEHGVTGADGISPITIHEFYDCSNTLIENVSQNALEDILEQVTNFSITTNISSDIPTGSYQLCDLFIKAYEYNNRSVIRQRAIDRCEYYRQSLLPRQ